MNTISRVLLPLLCLALGACAPVGLDLEEEPLVFRVPEVERLTLSNGIGLYLREDHELPLVEMSAMVGAGSIGEPADKAGMGGIFAATLRSGGAGSRSPEQLDERLEFLAADLSIATNTYTTGLRLSLRSADLEEGVAILADLLRRPAFDAGRLELSRKQAIEGIRRRDDDPGSLGRRLLSEALYPGHPLGRSSTVESVGEISREDLVAFHRRYFHPGNLRIAVTGDFERKSLIASLEAAFAGLQRQDTAVQPVPPLPTEPVPGLLLARKEVPQTTILFGDLGIDKNNPDLHAVRVMNYILGGGGFNSRLMREVRSDRGLAYSVYSYYRVGRRLPGPFVAGCETKSGSTVEVARLMRAIMEGMRSAPVSEEALRLAKDSLINSFVFAFTDSHEIVTQAMRLDYYGYPEGYLESYREKVAAVTVEDVQRVAREYLRPDRQVLVLVGDPASFDEKPEALGMPVSQVAEE